MNIPNLKLPADLRLDPTLEELVHKLSLAKPNWFFRQRSMNPNARYKGTLGPKSKTEMVAPEGIHFIREIEVVQSDRVAGTIEIGGTWNRPLEFELRSHRLSNGRKGNRANTTNIAKALSIAKKFFAPKNTGEILYGYCEDAGYAFRQATSRLGAERRHHKASTGVSAYYMQDYIRALLRNENPDPSLTNQMRELLLSESYETCLANYLLAQAMDARKYSCVAIIEGDYCMFTSDDMPSNKEEAIDAEIFCGPFEMLPSDVQNKLAVLQLMVDNELVLDVGFKASANVYLVVE